MLRTKSTPRPVQTQVDEAQVDCARSARQAREQLGAFPLSGRYAGASVALS